MTTTAPVRSTVNPAAGAARPLPEGFADLAPFVAGWALRSERERYHRLHSVRLEDLRPFYDTMLARIDAVLEHLDRYHADRLPDDAQTLFDLAMTFAETAHPLDLGWKDVDFPDACPWHRLEFRTVSNGA